MADKKIYTSLDFLKASVLIQAAFEKLAADPSSPVEAQEWFNTTEKLRKTVANGTVESYAFRSWVTEQINALGRAQGSYDASGGGLPVFGDKITGDLTTIQAGDAWFISNGGTITGILGDDELSIGDKLQFTGGDPAVAANWVGIQTNLDDSLIGNIKADRQVVALVANTPLTVSSSIIADIHGVQVYDSSNNEIEVCVSKNANANQRIIESNVSLTGVIVELMGESS
jgi:hypothetical protein